MAVNVPLSNATVNILQGTYFDDYDEDKKFYRILFRPSTAVQARELTQLQTILQKQIQRHGDNIFKDGSVVDGCYLKTFSGTPFVRVVDSFLSNTIAIATVEDLDDTYTITNGKNSNTAVRAKLYFGKKGFQSNYPDTNRFYVQYVYTGKDGSNNDVGTFANGETLYIYSANQAPLENLSNTNIIASINVYTTNSSTNATGNGFIVSITDGVIYQKGFFQKVDKQYAVVNNYSSNAASQKVGFETVETIVTEYQDTSLNDNANGSSNYNAPGAHRLKLTPTLAVKEKNTASNNFFAILEFDGNNAILQNTNPVYAAIGTAIAQRTSEESGDYTIAPHTIQTSPNTDIANTFNYEISAGLSYVKGNRVQLLDTARVVTYRANTTQIVNNKAITANYGNYVYCKEVLGVMNFDTLAEVALYDTAFTSITDREGLSGSVSGSIVGYANIKTVVWYSGTRGTPDAQYYVYLFNVRMNTGKSFNSDVKSIYQSSGTYGKFKADLVLESSAAVIYDATITPMVFDIGYKAIKSLTPTGGSRDTSFYYRKTTSSTLYANGYMSFTLSGGLGAAGTEQLYNTDSREYTISLNANAYSSNVAGTVTLYSTVNSTASNSTATFVNGSSTTFEASFKVGDTIRISNTVAGTPATYRVGGITSNTLMYVYPAVTSNSVANTYQRYFQDGHIFNITDSMLTVTPASNTFTVATGITIDSGSGSTVYAQYPVIKSPAVQAAKTVSKNRLVKIDCSNNTANSVGPWSLGLPDVLKINKVWVESSSTYANTTANRVSWFVLDNGQRDDKYDLATLSVSSLYKSNITATSTILVDLDHLVSDTSSGIGYYSVDSYPIYTDGINSNSTTIAISDIPFYKSATSKVTYDLRNCIDFRPSKAATANSIANTNYANTLITINPASANSNTFSMGAYGQYHPEVDSVFMADYEYYLPRYDLILLNTNGRPSISKGVPDIAPKKPLNISDASVIGEAYVAPFPSLTTSEIGNRPDLAIRIYSRSNKRYTMQDIGVLEERIARLEYYTVLSTLEKSAKEIAIADSTGKDRFKNGIFADPFNSHAFGNPNDYEYRISIDERNSVARPKFKEHNVDTQYDSVNSSGVVKKGPYVMLTYGHEDFASQPYATKYRNCTESIWGYVGSLTLSPSQYIFENSNTLPAVTATIDNVKPMQDLINSGFINTQIYGAKSTAAAIVTKTEPIDQFITDVYTSQKTTQSLRELSVTAGRPTDFNLGTYVKSVSQVGTIKSTDVAFYATALKPNTRLHFFFDGVLVDGYVKPGTLAVDPANFAYGSRQAINTVTANGVVGSAIAANSSGGVAGIFSIPDGVFRTGDRRFLITNVDNLVTGADAKITQAEATFNASGLAVTYQSATLTTINPEIHVNSNTLVTYANSSYRIDNTPRWDNNCDPIAQSFYIQSPNEVGQFISKIDLYFKAKDPTKGISCWIVEMNNGAPDYTKVLGSAHLAASSVNISDDSKTATTFEFDYPIYVASGKDYAFMVDPDASSPEYLLWCAEVGGFDIGDYVGTQISSAPYAGVMFISSNKKTWTSIQKEDIKFKLYRCNFTSTSGTVQLNNESDEYLTLTGVVKANTTGTDTYANGYTTVGRSIQVNDVVYTTNTSKIANTSATAPFGIVQYYDETTGELILDSARPGFSNVVGSEMIQFHRILPQLTNTSITTGNTASSNLITSTIIAYANVASVDNSKYHSIIPKFAFMVPQATEINLKYKGTDTSNIADTAWQNITNEAVNELFDKEKIVYSVTNEASALSGNKSVYFQLSLSSAQSLLSPVVDLRRKSSYFIENIINNDVTNEVYKNGNALSKYVSKKVVLADGQDAEDIRVTLTAYRPINSDIRVYTKFQNAGDIELFDTKLWTPLAYLNAGDAIYSSQGSTKDYVEYSFGIPAGTSTTSNFNANSGVNNTTDFISITNNTFVNNQIVYYYTNTGNTVISGLANATYYYVVNADSTGLKLSASQGGANINLTASATIETGHNLRGYVSANVAKTAFTNPDNSSIVEYYDAAGGRWSGYKYFALKIVLISTDRVNVPRLNDVTAIALQI
jgi:hypothetical protein